MVLSADSAFIEEKNKLANKPILLYTLVDYDGEGTNLYFTEYEDDVVYAGLTYTKFPIKHDVVTDDAQGSLPVVKLTIGNVSRVIQGYLEEYDLRNKRVLIKLVWADQLADLDNYIEDEFLIEHYGGGEKAIEFTLTTKMDVLQLQLPSRKYWRNYCNWKFKSAQCAYAGQEEECNKTLTRCRELENTVRFGGFPSIPTRRLFLG